MTDELLKKLKEKYDKLYQVFLVKEIVMVEKNKKFGFVDSNTGKELTPIKYDNVYDPHDELICVSSDNKWGFINYKGEECIPLIYDDANSFYKGIAKVKLNDNIIYIGKEVEKVFNVDQNFANEYAMVVEGDSHILKINGFDHIMNHCKEVTKQYHSSYIRSCERVKYGLNEGNFNLLKDYCPAAFGLECIFIGDCDNKYTKSKECKRCWERALNGDFYIEQKELSLGEQLDKALSDNNIDKIKNIIDELNKKIEE